MNQFLSPSPIRINEGIAIVRIIIGLLLFYHGLEVFNSELMKGYAEWETFKGPLADFMVYAGKGTELLVGIFFILGLFTRAGAILAIGTFTYITFMIGHGRFWYEDQHPFLFALFGVLFLFTGPGAWSVDGLMFRKKAE